MKNIFTLPALFYKLQATFSGGWVSGGGETIHEIHLVDGNCAWWEK